MNVPFANAVAAVPAASEAQFVVAVPAGVFPGQQIEAVAPDGQRVRIIVPAGFGPGSQLSVAYQPQVAQGGPIAYAQPVSCAPQQHGMCPATSGSLRYLPCGGMGADPFGILSQMQGVVIKQQVQWAQVLVGFDMPNKFLVSDPVGGHDLFVAAERNNGALGMVGRQVFGGGFRPFTLDIALLLGPEAPPLPFIRLERPFKCTCCCFQRPQMHIYNALTNRLIGSTHEPFSCCHLRLGLRDESENDVLTVNHHCCDCSILCWGCPCGCQETNFEVRDGENVVGNIRRQFNTAQLIGMVTGVNADSDQFAVDFQDVQNPEWKAALIAMAIFLEYCYFTKGGEQAREQSALGRGVQAERNWG
mmetsp:Transcript_14796/g.26260  ORF Transcript_14796/g.26260 Transcript_14796/m.26260 type:complete len:360 (-) Transcript_14796:68-1147(-)